MNLLSYLHAASAHALMCRCARLPQVAWCARVRRRSLLPAKATRATDTPPQAHASLTPRDSPRLSRLPMRTTSLLLGVLGVAHAAIELTPDNFDDVVFNSGKAAFVKFLAPW